jgi:hypothetical protein
MKYPKVARKLYRDILPQIWQDKIDVLRGESQVFRPCFQETRSIFIHIPKAAGTSIARAIYGMNVGHKRASDYIRVSKKEFYRYFTFSFVRNPWDRAVSAYNFTKQGGTGLVKPLPNSVYGSAVFDNFETFVTEWLIYQDLDTIDVVFAPQYKYIYDKSDNLLVNYLGKVETLSTDIPYLESKLNKSIQLQVLNKSNRSEATYRSIYNDHTAEIIANKYKKDIELFSYTF